MKVIFIEDVPKIGRVGQTRTVADGFARNYLLPRKLAVIEGSQAATAMQSQLQKKIKQRELEEAEIAKLAEKIEGTEITIKARVGESEKLYGSVTGADIAEELAKSAGHDIDKKKIEMAEPIRQLGTHDVTIRFVHDVTAVIKVNVVPDEVSEEKAEKAEKKTDKKTKAKAAKKAKKEETEAAEAEVKEEEPVAEEAAPEPETEEPKAEAEPEEVKVEEPEPVSEEVEAIEEEMDAKE